MTVEKRFKECQPTWVNIALVRLGQVIGKTLLLSRDAARDGPNRESVGG